MENNVTNEGKSGNISQIGKNPYLCTATNLIENFLIIGYDEDVRNKEIYKEIEEILQSKKNSNEQPKASSDNTFFLVYSKAPPPSILSSICSKDDSRAMLEYDLISKLVFPTPPPVYYLLDQKKFEPNQYSVIFFMNSDTNEGSKVSFHGYSFIFYEKKEEKIEIKGCPEPKLLRVYYPKAFCIISQLPYFHQYYNLTKTIHDAMEFDSEIEIPLEIIIYNIVNYIPAPINHHMNISFFPTEMNPHKKPVNEKDAPNFTCLSGYPLFDFNLNEIFNILEPEKIAQILIWNFLEIDMLFFSKNIEVLNLIMYIIASFNYPCNDSIYQWHIVSVSKEEFEGVGDCKFVNKPMTTMVGINCSYDTIGQNTTFSKTMFIVDLDKKDFTFHFNQFMNSDEQEEVDKLICLFKWIHEVIEDKGPSKCNIERNIKKLISELEPISRKVLHANASHNGDKKQIIPKFLTSEVNSQTNKKTQEVYYSFILNILKTYYQKFEIVTIEDTQNNSKKIEYKTQLKKDANSMIKEEQIFYELFKSCTKFGSYMNNFMQHHTTFDLYHIPLIFSEEFLQMDKSIEEEYENPHHFSTMDKFYHQEKMDTFTFNLKEKTEVFNFKDFYTYFHEEIKEKMFNEFQESTVLNATRKKNQKNKIVYQYKKMELDNNVLYKFLYHLGTLSEEKINKILPSSQRLKTSAIKKVRYGDIAQSIEFGFLSNKTLTMNDLLEFSFIIYYSLTITLMTEDEFHKQFDIIFEFLKKQIYFLRKYIITILTIYHRHAKNLIAENKNYNHLLICYHRLVALLIKRKVIGNEDLETLFHAFSLIDNLKENYDDYLNKFDIFDEAAGFASAQQIIINDDKDKIQKSNSISSAQQEGIKQVENIGQADFKKRNEERNNYSIALRKNFCFDGFKKEDYILKIAENVHFEGEINFKSKDELQIIKPKLKFVCKKGPEFNNEYDIYSPLKIYNLCNQFMNKFLNENSLKSIENEALLILLINLLFYQLNIRSLEINHPMLFLSHFLKKK